MSAPFLLITSHKIAPGRLDEFLEISRTYEEFIYANEPDLLGYSANLNEERDEVSLMHIYRNADAAEMHAQLAAEKIREGLAVTETVRIEILGNPGPALGQAREANAANGVAVDLKPEALGGFTRN